MSDDSLWSDYVDETYGISPEEERMLENRELLWKFTNRSKTGQNLQTNGHLLGKFIIAGTGSSSFPMRNLNQDQQDTLDRLSKLMALNHRKWGDKLVILSGGALGWDWYIAHTAHKLGIPYVLSLPNKGYCNYYYGKANEIRLCMQMLDNALDTEYVVEDVYNTTGLYLNGKHSNFVRNDRMVNLANAFFVYDPTTPGTKHCFNSILKKEIPYRIF